MKNKEKMKILIIKLVAIGDVVHTMIIPKAIKLKHPDWEIHYMTASFIAPMIENSEYIDKIIPFNNDAGKSKKYLFDTIKSIRKEKYDIIFSLSRTLRLYLLSYLGGAKKVGVRKYFNKSWVEEYFYSAKELIKDIELPESLTLSSDPQKVEEIKNWMREYPKPHIILNAGAYYSGNRTGRTWNIEKWKELSEKLLQTYGGTIFVNGSSIERSEHLKLENERVHILSGNYSIEDSSIILSLADLVISGDSGPLHIASAFGVKTLAILGSTSPDKIKPYGANGYYIEPVFSCKYCWEKKCKLQKADEKYPPCIESITVDMVMDKIRECELLK